MNVDIRTRYLGLDLANPLIASASPMTGRLENLKRLQDEGIAAVVLPSLFEEALEHEEMELHRLEEFGTESFAEATDYLPPAPTIISSGERYLELIAEAKKALSVPVIASLNGTSTGGWTHYAHRIEEAGADALELNIYLIAADPTVSGEAVEQQYVDLVHSVREVIDIPLAVKVGPYFSSVANMMHRLANAGANGLVLFNRFMQPDVDLESLTVVPHVELSTSYELRLPLRWIAILRDGLDASLAATTGVHHADDVVKLLLCGADATMLASALLRSGPTVIRRVLRGLEDWMEENEYTSVEQLKGSMSRAHSTDPAAFERANYMRALVSYTGPHI